VFAAPAGAVVASNGGAIAIPDSGAASPYPSGISLSGTAGTITNTTVTLRGFSHSEPSDLRLLLVAPSGRSTLLMSQVGGEEQVSNLTVTFSDAAPDLVPSDVEDDGTFNSGAYKPTPDDEEGDALAGAPAPPYGSTLSALNGSDANGAWKLYVLDAAAGDSGQISGGWTLDVTTTGGGGSGGGTNGGGGSTLSASSLSLTPATFRPFAAVNGRPVSRGLFRGTRVGFRLSRGATVDFFVHRLLPGRRVGTRCLAQNRLNRTRPRCVRAVYRGKFFADGSPGAQSARWNGWLAGRRLAAGNYRLMLTARAAGGVRSNSLTRVFRVL